MDNAHDAPTLQSLFRATEHRQNVAVLALLTWAASCDGSIAEEELAMLREVAAGVEGGRDVLPAVIDIARQGRPEDLEFACRYFRNHAKRADRPLLAQLFVSMAARDGHLTVAENHVLRFLADLLGLPARKFAKLFEAVTHRPFPEVGDVSSIEWWRRREAGGEARPPPRGWGTERASRGNGNDGARVHEQPHAQTAAQPVDPAAVARASALRMFGLEDGASGEEVRAAYRRLVKARHPDRFARLGPAAQAAATDAFQRLQEAYALLSPR